MADPPFPPRSSIDSSVCAAFSCHLGPFRTLSGRSVSMETARRWNKGKRFNEQNEGGRREEERASLSLSSVDSLLVQPAHHPRAIFVDTT